MTKCKRVISALICVVMLLTMLPAGAFAADPAGQQVIDFTDETAMGRDYTIDGKTSTSAVSDAGLYMTATMQGFEKAGDHYETGEPMLSDPDDKTPVDVVKVPISGDKWAATLEFDFDPGTDNGGYYEFFSFLAMQDDYNHGVGIRGANEWMQNWIRSSEENLTSGPTEQDDAHGGFQTTGAGTFWWKIERDGTTYTVSQSRDGSDYTELFKYENSAVDATTLVIDAYSGMNTGYIYYLKSLTLDGVTVSKTQNIDFLNPAESGKFKVESDASVTTPSDTRIEDGVGLYMISTNDCPESAGQGKSYAPKDMVMIPTDAEGDWTATIKFRFDQGTSSGAYEYFAFWNWYSKNHFRGHRGGSNDRLQWAQKPGVPKYNDDGTPQVDDNGKPKTSTAGNTDILGLQNVATDIHYMRIQKTGSTYKTSYSNDGKTWSDVFTHEDVANNGDQLVLDAYSGMDVGNQYYIEYLYYGADDAAMQQYGTNNAAKAIARQIPDTIEVPETGYRLPAAINDYKVSYSATGATVTDNRLTGRNNAKAKLTITVTSPTGEQTATQTVETTLKSEGGGEGPDVGSDDVAIWEDSSGKYSFAERAADLVARMSVAQKGSQMISSPAPAITADSLGGGALNVPSTKNLPSYYWWSEGLHGYNRIDNGASVRGGGAGPANAVSYPQSLTVGSTWNPELYYKEAQEVSDEIRERTSRNTQTGNAIDLNFYSPTVNLQRDPRWGRNEESYSEDPLLTAVMGSQYALGLEGKDQDGNLVDPNGYYKLHSTIKHYTANNSEDVRLNNGANVEYEDLRNYYTAPYRDIIQATNISSVMTAYSTVNKEPASYSSYLMDTLLRQTFGLTGYVTSDCDSVGTMTRHNYINPHTGKVLTDDERLAGALAHGEDLECNGGYSSSNNYSTNASRMVNGNIMTDKGLFTENSMDISLHRLLTARIATGEFDDDLQMTKDALARIAEQQAAAPGSAVYNQTRERLDIVDQVNNEGVVLLQNEDNFLPLKVPASGEYKVAIIGSWQTNMYLGLYSANEPDTTNQINIQKGITNAIQAKNPDATFTYIPTDTVSEDNKAAVEAADLCVVVYGTSGNDSSEDRDRPSIKLQNNTNNAAPWSHPTPTWVEKESLFTSVGDLNENTVAVLETCGPMDVHNIKDSVKAILWSSYGGLHKGVGFGNVLTGAVNPSGKLTATWYRSDADLPDMQDYRLAPTDSTDGRTYMYFQGDAEKIAYPFGYGLSYTTYEYSNLTIDKEAYDANDTVKVGFDVKNTGSVDGKEVTQLYIAQPGNEERPIRRLEGFKKVDVKAGETVHVDMEVAIPDLAYFNEEDDFYSVDTGAYQVQVGGSSATATLTKDFTVSGEMDEYPKVLTVKAHSAEDAEENIEQRLIYSKGDVIVPQLTLAMNNEKLYGYIIADQQSPIKSYKANENPMPADMRFTYTSNRENVVKVDGDKIRAVGAGVATVTVTGQKGNDAAHKVTTEFVVYVEAGSSLSGITVNGEPIPGFDSNETEYELCADDYTAKPTIEATASAEVTYKVTFDAFPGVATITATNTESGESTDYHVGFGKRAAATDFTKATQTPDGWTVLSPNAANAKFDGKGLTITPEAGSFDGTAHPNNVYLMQAAGDWVATTHMTLSAAPSAAGQQAGLVVYGDDATSFRIVTDYAAGWGASPVLRVYHVDEGSNTQIASVNLNAADLYLRIEKSGSTYTACYSTDGEEWAELGSAAMRIALPQMGVTAAGTGYTATFDGINVDDYADVHPALADLLADGKTIEGFNPDVKNVNVEITGEAAEHTITATPANPEDTVKVEPEKITTGTAKVTVTGKKGSTVYTVSYNYGPKDSYFGDGELDDAWMIEKPLESEYKLTKGAGLQLATQAQDFYQDGTDWHNAFTMPAQGTWTAVIKAHYPTTELQNYQQLTVSVWQDEDNYVRINAQTSALTVEPGLEVNGIMHTTDVLTGGTAAKADDGTATIYFRINRQGDDYTVGYGSDGANFTDCGSVTANFANPKIILSAGQNSDATPAWLNFEYVAVTSQNGVDANANHLQWAAQQVANYVAADLPAKTNEDLTLSAVPHGYTVELASSNPAVIGTDGKVTVPAADADVNVTVTVKGEDGDVTATATKMITVSGAGGDEPQQPADKTVLNKAIADAKAVDAGKYTDDSVKAMNDALAAAEKVAADDKATQDDVDAAAKALNDAIKALVPAGGDVKPTIDDFTDVVKDPKFWYHDGIDYMVKNGLMNGTDATTFKPLANIKRGDLVQILYRIEKEPDVSKLSNPFQDIQKDYYKNAITWAADKKIVNGKTDTKFGPEDPITREQLAAMLYRWAGAKAPADDKLAGFPDGGKVQSYAKDAMNWAVDQGIITGVKDEKTNTTTLNPQGNANRAQIAVMLERYLNK